MKSYEKNHGKKESILYFSTLRKVKVLVAQSCLTLCNPMDYSLPSSSYLWNSPVY